MSEEYDEAAREAVDEILARHEIYKLPQTWALVQTMMCVAWLEGNKSGMEDAKRIVEAS